MEWVITVRGNCKGTQSIKKILIANETKQHAMKKSICSLWGLGIEFLVCFLGEGDE
jgi:hypothetical protein